jgi:hypothetical protein
MATSGPDNILPNSGASVPAAESGPINNRPQVGNLVSNLPRIAASRKRGVLDASGIWPIDNRPQATSLPHNARDLKIVAAHE